MILIYLLIDVFTFVLDIVGERCKQPAVWLAAQLPGLGPVLHLYAMLGTNLVHRESPQQQLLEYRKLCDTRILSYYPQRPPGNVLLHQLFVVESTAL